MKLEIINNIRVITPDDEMWLCNEEQKVVSDKVYLGVNADETLWRDITEKAKIAFETLWNEEVAIVDESSTLDPDDISAEEFMSLIEEAL